jgi:hypothetical protein
MSDNIFSACEDIPTLIHQLVGVSSTCWQGGTGDAVFDTALATKTASHALTRLHELAHRYVTEWEIADEGV